MEEAKQTEREQKAKKEHDASSSDVLRPGAGRLVSLPTPTTSTHIRQRPIPPLLLIRSSIQFLNGIEQIRLRFGRHDVVRR